MNKSVKIGMLGFGTVGSGVWQIVTKNADEIATKIGCPIEVSKILVRDKKKYESANIDDQLTTEVQDIINDPDIQIVVEVMGGKEPALTYMLAALRNGKHVVTANKDVVAEYGKELFDAAAQNSVDFMFEGSVGGGIPIIRPLKQCLAANRISEVMGIVNGTTNYMLSKMANEHIDFATVLAQAQAQGYAEADPTADVGGWDAARKIAILASIAFGTRINLDDVYVEGITNISLEDIEYAKEFGYVIKLLAIAKEYQDEELAVNVRVHPAMLPCHHPLTAVQDVFNAIYVKGDAVGETMFYGRGAGKLPTASAVVGDIIDIARNIQHHAASRILCTCFGHKPVYPMEKTESPYYMRLLVADQPGVLAAIAAAFGAQQVSLHTVVQKRKVNQYAELVLITYRVSEVNMQLAINILRGMSIVAEICSVIRVEEDIK